LFAQQHGGNDTFIVEDSCHIRLDEATKETPRDDIAKVAFEATPNTKYAIDPYRDVYAKVTEFLQKYKASNKDMAASAKFMLPGVSDEIFVRVIESKEGFDPAKVHFVTDKGQEYKGVYYAAKNGWTVNLAGSAAGDGQHLYVVHEVGKGNATLARLNIYTYEPKTVKIKLVPVNGFTNGFTAGNVSSQLNSIYQKVGITCEVEVAPSFGYTFANGTFNVTGSGLFSTLTDDMKALNAAYQQAHPGEESLCLFIIENATGTDGIAGDMPRGKQFGYLFQGSTSQTIAHEIGHGLFHLDHPFDRANASKSFDQGDLPDNLMEYGGGTNLVKLQWDAIHSPGLVIGLFERDEQGMAIDLQRVKDKLKEILKDLTLNSGHAMLTAIINGIYIDNFIDWSLSKWTFDDIQDALKAINEYIRNQDVTKLMEKISEIISKHTTNSEASQLMDLTSMSWIENLQTKDVSSATSLTNKMVNSNKDAATVIFGLLFEFKYGIGPQTREFDENSVLTKGIKDFYLVEEGRDYFYQTRAKYTMDSLYLYPIAIGTVEGEFYPQFGATGAFKAGADLVKQYIGGFYMEMFPDKQGEGMGIILHNDVNLKSLVLHYLYINDITEEKIFPEQYPRVNGEITPLGEIKQVLRWKERIIKDKFKH
jgi:hypothetical protein